MARVGYVIYFCRLLTNPLVGRLSWRKVDSRERFSFGINEIAIPPKPSNTLTEAELRLMKILWRRGESSVTDLVAALPGGESLAYNSVLTTVRILEQKGYVRHRQQGRAFVYAPLVAEQEAGRSEVRNVLNRFFGNSREQLVLSLLGDDGISAEELRHLKEAIRQAESAGSEA